MFGGTSSWGQNNQQQQQQPQGGGLFGGGGGFGQQQQPQQQQNTGFGGGGFGQQQPATGGGLFGGNTGQTSTFGSGGGFGASAQPTSTFGASRPTFGATGQSTFGGQQQQNTGGGLFGNTTSTFGAQPQQQSGGLFGAKPATTSTFGSGATSGLFGAKPATSSPFGGGAATGSQAQNPNALVPYYGDRPAPPPPQTGTADPAYYPTWQQDPATGTGTSSTLPPHLFHSISAMEAYRGASPDELRAMDYQQNRKNATPQQQQQPAATGGFGAPASGGFGQPAQTNTFGQQASTSTFGAPKPAGGLFGASSTGSTGGFGQTSGGFGQTGNTGGGLFGQAQQQPASTGFGQTNNTGGGLFGQSNTTQPATGGGLFGNTSTGFGAQQNQQQPAATNSFGTFGAAKPATTGFGATSGGFGASGSTFGQQPAANTGSTFGGFGGQQQQQQQQPAAGGGLFGGGGFGQNNQQQQPAQNTGGGLFGQTNNQQQQQTASGGLFGSTAPKPGGLFGSTANTGTTGATGSTGFSFGQNNTQQPAATGGGLFGATNNTQNNTTGGGLFGQQNQQQNTQQPATGGGLFGGTGGGGLFGAKPATTGATGGLFGSTPQNQQQPAQTGSLFGNTGQTGGGLFGSQNNTLGQQNQQNNQPKPGGLFGGGGGLFGGGQTQQQPQTAGTTGGGLFGNLGQSQPAQTSLFGGQTQQQPQQAGMGGSLFGGGGGFGLGQSGTGQQQQQQQQQPSLNASIDQNPYGRSDLFNYTGQKLEFGSQNKKPALPPLTASSYRITPSKSQINKLRGFATPLGSSQSPGRSASPLSSSTRGGGLNSPSSDRYRGLTDAALTPNAFVPRPSIKRLNVTPQSNGVSAGNGSDDHLESVLGKSALRSSTPRQTPAQNGLSSSSRQSAIENTPQKNDTPSRREATPLDSSRSLAVAGSEKQPSNGQYWCKPRMEKLRQMGEGYLSKISNFTVGRVGYGEVTFLEPVDVTAFDLNDLFGKVVVFTEMELAVYPDDWEDKPEQGKGLNHPARVTLLNCFPRDKASKQPITDLNDPRHARFLKRVKNIPETEFVSYTDDGAWTFEVKHFSKYGLRDDDSEEDEEDAGGDRGLAARQKLKAKEAFHPYKAASRTPSRTPESDQSEDDFLPPTKSLHDVDHDSGFDDEEVFSDEEDQSQQDESASTETSGESDSQPPGYDTEMEAGRDEHVRQRLGHEGMMKLREMKSSLFGFEDQHQRPQEVKRGLGRTGMRAETGIKRTLQDRLAGFGDAGEDQSVLDKRAVKRPSFGIKPSPPVLRQPRRYARVALADSVEKDHEGVRVDAGLALGRSFRCSWGPNGELVHFGKLGGPAAHHTPSANSEVSIESVSLLSDDATAETARAERLLRAHLIHTDVRVDEDGIPYATLSPSIRFRDFASLFDAGDRSHEATIFRLGQALFDEIDLRLPADSAPELVDRILGLRRKLALSQWLENAVAPAVDSDLLKNGENRPAKLFTLLSGNSIARAVDMALEGNDMRLASLIAQAGRTGEFRDEILRQLDDWKKYHADSVISADYRRVYALLAGITDISPGNKARGSDSSPDILVSKDLDWKRAFGLRLWFSCPFESSISAVFDDYDASLSADHPPATPIPPYLESNKSTKWSTPTRPTDATYNLIRLYSDITVSLEQVLAARDASPSPTDLRLPWHLYLLLSRVLRKRDFIDRDEEGYSAQADRLTQAYAAQLEQNGQWTLAAFVLLHLEASQGREQAIRALLHRNPVVSESDRTFLVDRLHIPIEWLHEARAASLSSRSQAFDEYHALIDAKLYERAHRILLDKLAPEAIMRKDLSLLAKLCQPLDGKPDGWQYGGKLLLDYISIDTEVPSLLKDVVSAAGSAPPAKQARLVQLANDIPRLLRLLPALFPDNNDVQQVACLSDMLSGLHHLAGQLSLANYMARPSVSDSLVDVDRLHLLQNSAYDSFNSRLEGLLA